MNLRSYLILGLFLVWSFICWRWYVCNIKQKCCDDECCKTEVIQEPIAVKNYGPLVFNWKNPEPITNELFASFKDSINAGIDENGFLKIIGKYYATEPIPDGFENMGIARAEKVKALFADKLGADKIITSSKLVGTFDGDTTTLFASIDFERMINELVSESSEGIVIHFPTNSNKKLADKRIDDFLAKLAQRLNNSQEKVIIIGHTDNQGEADANEKLALSRAEAIKAQIVALGIDASRITTSSMGETAPIATNETEAGRQENRRAEIKFQ